MEHIAERIVRFIHITSFHGALGDRPDDSIIYDQKDLFFISPLFFYLTPHKVLTRSLTGHKYKKAIAKYHSEVGINENSQLIDIIFNMSDQYFSTSKTFSPDHHYVKRKGSLAKLRSNPILYKKVLTKQNYKCDICGVDYESNTNFHLDHIIPWRLLGDPDDGLNWRILCDRCNRGKGSFLSAMQTKEFNDWYYSNEQDQISEHLFDSSILRYVCYAMNRNNKPINIGKGKKFNLRKKVENGLFVFSNLEVYIA